MPANLTRSLQYTLVAATLWMAGCANLTSMAPGTPAAEIAASRGKPARIWPEANGASTWEYPQGPQGRFTFMIRVGADGRVAKVDQVLDWPFFNTLRPGMKADEVEHVLGRPYSVTYLPLLNENVLAWRWVETVWPRCFYAYMDLGGALVRTGVRDEEVSDRGLLTAAPC